MTLKEAIRDLQARVDGELYIKGIDKCEDIKLGIEALKREGNSRDKQISRWILLLPGETEKE